LGLVFYFDVGPGTAIMKFRVKLSFVLDGDNKEIDLRIETVPGVVSLDQWCNTVERRFLALGCTQIRFEVVVLEDSSDSE
jgi:hypothetical protein